MDSIFQGYTRQLSSEDRALNQVKACAEILRIDPLNQYWQHRLDAAVADFLRVVDEWANHIIQLSEPNYNTQFSAKTGGDEAGPSTPPDFGLLLDKPASLVGAGSREVDDLTDLKQTQEWARF